MALLALVLQLGLSFGHVHGLHSARAAAAVSAIAGNDTAPVNNSGDHDDDDYCAICAILALLTGAQTASAPVIAVPVAIASTEQPVSVTAILSEPKRFAFRSRAPPQA